MVLSPTALAGNALDMADPSPPLGRILARPVPPCVSAGRRPVHGRQQRHGRLQLRLALHAIGVRIRRSHRVALDSTLGVVIILCVACL
jgi:hypothetical protein